MTLPNINNLLVPEEKIKNYLLSFEHRDGRSKANFFTKFGFLRDNWQELANALEAHAKEYEVVKIEPSPFGKRYIIEGAIQCPDGRKPSIRAIWFIGFDEEFSRFVTAYPLARGREK